MQRNLGRGTIPHAQWCAHKRKKETMAVLLCYTGLAALVRPPSLLRAGRPVMTTSISGQIGAAADSVVSGVASALVNVSASDSTRSVTVALRRLERDVLELDNMASARPQLNNIELILLSSSVGIAATSPYLVSLKVVEVLVPAMAALSAAIGLSAEYAGKVAVARGKEIAANTLQAAAEAEALLAQAERAKAVIPLCVGLSATFAAFALLVPSLLTELTPALGVQVITEIYLVCPLFAVLAAAVASLAVSESTSLCGRAIGVGARRFSTAGVVGRTWLSATEQIEQSVARTQSKWSEFALGVLPAPVLGVLVPGPLAFKAIVAAATAAAQTAYSLARAEYSLARALDAVALKSRSAAVSDTYANQGARAGAILPFTSALSSLCAATSVAVVEVLPFFNSVPTQSLTCVAFPFVGSLVAAAASVSKARCEVDAAAATAAAEELASPEGVADLDFLNPLRGTVELVYLLLKPTLDKFRRRFRQLRGVLLGREGRIQRAQAEWRAQFDSFDTDGDGKLTAGELARILPTLNRDGRSGPLSSDQLSLGNARSILAQLEIAKDDDGTVAWPSFNAIMKTQLYPEEMQQGILASV